MSGMSGCALNVAVGARVGLLDTEKVNGKAILRSY